MSKKIKALLAVVLCAAMLIAAASPAFAAVDDNGILRFNKDGKLKIMQISDTQDIDIPREAMIMFMEKALDAAPDTCYTDKKRKDSALRRHAAIVSQRQPFQSLFVVPLYDVLLRFIHRKKRRSLHARC